MREVFEVHVSSHANDIQAFLPITPYQLLDMLEQLRLQPDENPSVDVRECVEPFEFLNTEMHCDCSLQELNDLAMRLSSLDEEGQIAFDGLVKMELDRNKGAIPVGKLIDLAYSVDCCDVHPGVATYEELGHFYVEQGLFPELKAIPEEDIPFLNYKKIGEKFSKEEGGVLVSGGYVLQTSDLKQISQSLDQTLRKPGYAILLEVTQGGRAAQLYLPASPQAMDAALDAIGARDWGGVSLECLDCAATPLIPFLGGHNNISHLNRLAGMLERMDDKQLTKFKAVLDAAWDYSVLGATHIATTLDDYILTPQCLTVKDLARDYIRTSMGEIAATKLYPFVQLEMYGAELMEEQGGELTGYGMVSRENGQRLKASPSPSNPVQNGMTML